MTAYIGHHSAIEASGVTITPNFETTGFEAANVVHRNLQGSWKPGTDLGAIIFDLGSAQECDYVFIHGHDLFTQGASYAVQTGSTDNGSTFDEFHTGNIVAGSDRSIFNKFTAATRRYWRFVATGPGSAAKYISILMIGKALPLTGDQLEFKAPFEPLGIIETASPNQNINNLGQPIGRSIRAEPFDITLSWKVLDPSWVRSNLDDLSQSINRQPFGLSWDYDNQPDEVALLWTTKELKPPKYGDTKFMQWQIRCKGLRE
ncbi:hypothetical protein [uncultured Paraglaciecola sp.]|uniref:hypothetical protein n=1 Tax=uncultured Paraglaciecola sp. TaxID=1765024 RepID=UPI00262AEB60|nr:hypothetical protein [uncultured Paraglaciecola sp.]